MPLKLDTKNACVGTCVRPRSRERRCRRIVRGQKYNDDIKERAFAMAATNNSISAVARELGVPRSTVKGWLEAQSDSEKERREKLRRENKDQFVDDAWKTIHKGNQILMRRFERAADSEAEIDRLLEEFMGCGDLTLEHTKALRKQFEELKLMDVGKIAVVLGTLYDKQALIAKEATARVEMVEELTFEDFDDDLE